MLGNLHVRFGVGAGVKFPGLHHFILARGGQTYARLRLNAGVGAELVIPMAIDYSRPFAGSDFAAWDREYRACVQQAEVLLPRTINGLPGSSFGHSLLFEEAAWPAAADDRIFDQYPDFSQENSRYDR